MDTLRNLPSDIDRYCRDIAASLERQILDILGKAKEMVEHNSYIPKRPEDTDIDKAERFVADVLRDIISGNAMYTGREGGKKFIKEFNRNILELFDV